jgi:hypothetical protein
VTTKEINMQLTLPGLSDHAQDDVLAVAIYALADALDAVYADPTAHPVLPAFPLDGPEADRARALYRHARRCVTGRGVPVRETDRLRIGQLGQMRRGRITIKRTLPPGYKLAALYHESAHALYHRAEAAPACLSPTHRHAVEVHADTLTACSLVVQGFDVCSDVWRLRAHGCRPAFLRSRVGPLVQAAAYLLAWTSRDPQDCLPPVPVQPLSSLFEHDDGGFIPCIVASAYLDETPLPLPGGYYFASDDG